MLVLEEAFSGKEKLALLGFSLSRVWTYGFLMLAAQGIANLELITNLRVSPVHAIFFTCGTIVALTFAFLAPKIEPWFNRHTYHCVAIVGTLAAICLACSLMSGLGILWFIALLLGGSTLALIRMSWGQIYGKLDPRFMGLYTGLSFCCAVIRCISYGKFPNHHADSFAYIACMFSHNYKSCRMWRVYRHSAV